MRMYDIIKKKRDGGTLTKEEIEFFISGYVSGDIPDYQASALLMAIYFRGMNVDETTCLTLAITNSGDKVDLSGIKGFKADKHSTGGVGDKTTLIVAPIVASAGVKVAKMSGRGLGHTGGTVDKLESIPGYETSLSRERFFEIVNTVGCSVIGQSGELAPADKKLYALRDVTATVDKRPLIASSIMGKKLASGADGIVLDVKVGSGAFNKTFDEGLALAKIMVNIGNKAGKITRAVITNMDKPLGYAVGNAIEVKEAVHISRKPEIEPRNMTTTEEAVINAQSASFLTLLITFSSAAAYQVAAHSLTAAIGADKSRAYIAGTARAAALSVLPVVVI